MIKLFKTHKGFQLIFLFVCFSKFENGFWLRIGSRFGFKVTDTSNGYVPFSIRNKLESKRIGKYHITKLRLVERLLHQ